ncbi:MAG: reverse transcriptase/maturase family protein [Sulfuricurvum sp.]|nr:reverse transcriptase/maturase family protein [Sulfuricurvum sp.]
MGKIFDRIATMENALASFRVVRRGHSEDLSMLKFEADLMTNVSEVLKSVREGTYRVRGYRTLIVREPKQRDIFAPYLEDRLVQQMIYGVIEPYLDRKMDFYSCACRTGKGVEFARKSCQRMMRQGDSVWYVKLDIDKFFASIDHDILKSILAKHIRDKEVLALVCHFIGNGFGHRGIPIGNLLSQLFANLYLNELDGFIRSGTKTTHYVRYMDDFICFARSKEEAKEIQKAAIGFVNENLHLSIDNRKVKLQRVRHGVTFLGHRIMPHRSFLSKTKTGVIKRRLKRNARNARSSAMSHSLANIVPKDDHRMLGWLFDIYNRSASYVEKLDALRAFSKKFSVSMIGDAIVLSKALLMGLTRYQNTRRVTL